MGKIILFIVIGLLLLGFLNYLIFFWMKRRRIWNKEDRLALREAKREALQEFRDSQETIEEFMTRDYTKPSIAQKYRL